MLRDAGRYVIVGQYTNAGDISLNPHFHINRKHATILGCWGYEFTHLHRCLEVMARHAARFDWGSLVSAGVPPRPGERGTGRHGISLRHQGPDPAVERSDSRSTMPLRQRACAWAAYEILAPLGAAGWAWSTGRATRGSTARSRSRCCPTPSRATRERLARFEREARLLAALNHPNIAAIYGLEERTARRFLVLEFVEGETLAERLARGRCRSRRRSRSRQIAGASRRRTKRASSTAT